MNDKQTAKRLFLEILRRTKGGQRQVYYALADIYSFRNEKEKAAICYKRILSFDPGNSIAKTALENISAGQISSTASGNSDNKDKDAVLAFNEGNDKYEKGDIDGAIASYNKATELNPSYYKAYNNLGIVKASTLKHYADALGDFNKAIEIKPDYADAYMGRGSCFFAMKETEKACQDWQKALSLGNSQVGKIIQKYCK
jgi:tetratricopeptide (TPR) repeat protein